MLVLGAYLLDWLWKKVDSNLLYGDSNGFFIRFSQLIMVVGLVNRLPLRLKPDLILNSLCQWVVVTGETPFAGWNIDPPKILSELICPSVKRRLDVGFGKLLIKIYLSTKRLVLKAYRIFAGFLGRLGIARWSDLILSIVYRHYSLP